MNGQSYRVGGAKKTTSSLKGMSSYCFNTPLSTLVPPLPNVESVHFTCMFYYYLVVCLLLYTSVPI